MKNWKIIFLTGVGLLAGLAACVKVDLIDITNRATTSLVKLSFNWDGQEKDKPQQMQLIAVRNVKTWRAHGFVKTEPGQNVPWFGYSEPLIEETPVVPSDPTTPDDPSDPTTPDELSDSTTPDNPSDSTTPGDPSDSATPETYPFRLKGGEYNILVVNYGLNTENMELKCLQNEKETTVSGNAPSNSPTNDPSDSPTDNPSNTPEQDEDNSLKNYFTDYNRKVNELFLCIKPVEGDPEEVVGKDLPDFNPQYDYVRRVPKIFYGLKSGVHAVPGIDTEVEMDMQPISQEVQVIFTVELIGDISIVENEKPVVELSGICGHFNLMEAYVDTTKLYRSVEYARLEPENQTGKQLVYIARFHTLGIVPSFDETYMNGPGIFQVAVKVKSNKADSKAQHGRYVYAGINPHKELSESQIIVEGTDGKLRLRLSREPIVVKVEKHLVIDENLLVDPGDGLGWEQHDPDDDANVEI